MGRRRCLHKKGIFGNEKNGDRRDHSSGSLSM